MIRSVAIQYLICITSFLVFQLHSHVDAIDVHLRTKHLDRAEPDEGENGAGSTTHFDSLLRFVGDGGKAAPMTDREKELAKHIHPDMTVAEAQRFVEEHLTEEEREKGRELHKTLMKSEVAAKAQIDRCQSCLYVMEKIKMGYQYLLPSVCVELYSTSENKDAFGYCHEVLAVLSVWGNNVKSWMSQGCYKTETYGAIERILPCPSHVVCAQMKNLKNEEFCKVNADYDGKGSTSFPKCEPCIYALERYRLEYPIKHPDPRSICIELYDLAEKTKKSEYFAACEEMLTVLGLMGRNVDSWIRKGCWKTEPYGSESWITPCPAHVICSELEDLTSTKTKTKTFCETTKIDYGGVPE
eukprot:g1718.t1